MSQCQPEYDVMSHHNFWGLCIAFSEVSTAFCFLKLLGFSMLVLDVKQKMF